MSPRAFDRMMIEVEIGGNAKIGRLSDAQFRCLLTGVWALAAKAMPRGYLVVADEPATAHDVAHQAHCTPAVARKTLELLRSMEMIEMDDQLGVEFVHDWWSINPDPKPDPTNAERQRRFKAKRAVLHTGGSNALGNAPVTALVTPEVTPTEVKEKEKVGANAPNTSSRSSEARDLFAYWQQQCRHPSAVLDGKRRGAIESRLRDGFTVSQIQSAIRGAAKAPYVDPNGKRFDDIELICRNASKLESFIERDTAASTNVISMAGRPSRSTSGSDYDKAAGL